MQWMAIASGLMLLLLAGVMPRWFRKRSQGNQEMNHRAKYCRLRRRTKTVRLLTRAARLSPDAPGTAALHCSASALMEHAMRLNREIRQSPALPGGDGEPRIMDLARSIADQGDLTTQGLMDALAAWDAGPATPSEIVCLPLCVKAACCDRLNAVLTDMLAGHADEARQLLFCDEIRRAEESLGTLIRMNWQGCCEQADVLHGMLAKDPGGVYPRMDPDSRLMLRREVERFCKSTGLAAEQVVSCAIKLSQDAEAKSLENYVGFWFQDASGMRALHRTLQLRKGYLYAHLSLQRHALHYAGLWILGAVFSFLFLQSGNPVWMLPFFTITSGVVWRTLLEGVAHSPLPGMDIAGMQEELKTLVVLPCELHDSHQAIAMVRRLKTAIHAFPEEGVDFLLLGDFAESMTIAGSGDNAIIQAAAAALAALEDPRCQYIQRSRVWNSDRHLCCARGGMRGAVTEICRLIAQGECKDVFAFSTVEAARLERRYAYVLVLPPDTQPAPGMLEALLRSAAHPLCQRYPLPSGWRGYSILSPGGSDVFEGTGLIRPDAYLEATDELLPPQWNADPLCGELAGYAAIPAARTSRKPHADTWEALYQRSVRAWRLFSWQLPWVQTPAGLVRNPLGMLSRFRLREGLRRTLIPAARCGLLLFALLTGSWWLLAISLFAPEAGQLPRSKSDFIRLVCRLSLLPSRAAVNLRGLTDVLRRKAAASDAWPTLEIWAQGLAATLTAAIMFAVPEIAVPALALAVLFGCFPLAHRFYHAPMLSDEELGDDQHALLESTAASTWKFFAKNSESALPPYAVQFQPPLGAESATSPSAIGALLLACMCTKEMGQLSAPEAAEKIKRCAEALAGLSMPLGLPCRRYALPSLAVADARVDAAETGFLWAALMTTAQALRSWLPELPQEYLHLSASLSSLCTGFDLSRLYDPDAGLFHAQLDENGQGQGYISTLYDAGLLLSVTACAQKRIPPEHFAHLSRTSVVQYGQEIALSPDGTAESHLLAGLFLPVDEQAADPFIRSMARRGRDGVFGQGKSGYFGFDGMLRYRRGTFGLQEAALSAVSTGPVYAPYAAALCLPFAPRLAADALARYASLGALGPLGLCDALDFSQGTAIVGLHDTFHQGLILMSAVHILAESPIRRHFCAIPEVEACLPLLESIHPPLRLPALPIRRPLEAPPAAPAVTADPLAEPVQTHLLGTDDFSMLVDARGCSSLRDGDIELTMADPEGVYGVQFYLRDEGRTYRLGDGLLQGETVFAAGEVRCVRLCGSLRAELVCTVDTVRKRALHILTITNLSTRDREIETASFLLPDLGAPEGTLEASHAGKGLLKAWARGTDTTLLHTLDASMPTLKTTVCMDADAFLGRRGTLHLPASLEKPAVDTAASDSPCLAFRTRIRLGGRGQVVLWFTTSLVDSEPPRLSELEGLRQLSALQHAAMHRSAAIHPTAIRLPRPNADVKQPFPARLPEITLEHSSSYGGFDADTGEYMVRLGPGKATPVPWENQHISRYFSQIVDESGFCGPFHEQLWLQMDDGTLLSPWSASLPRSIQMGSGLTVWDAWSDQLDIRLCASCMPGHRCGLRALRIRNATDDPLTIRLSVLARLAGSATVLETASGIIMTNASGRTHAFLAGEGWEARRTFMYPGLTSQPCLNLPDDPNGSTAQLDCTLTIAPQASATAVWLAGYARHAEDIARAMACAAGQGASALMRQVRSRWAQQLDHFRLSTPEATLDLLVNRILPRQALCAAGTQGVPALAFLDPPQARRRLLQTARKATTRQEWLSSALLTGAWGQLTGDTRILDAYLPHQDTTLYQCICRELLSLPLDRQGLPLGENPALPCMQYALAAKWMHQLRPNEALEEFSCKLLAAADTQLWREGYYGGELRLDVQCLACLCYGSNPRTRQAVRTAWNTLYDQPHGLVRSHAPQDIPLLPGLPGNGGMRTRDAALCLHALLMTAHEEEAFELLRALNPIHHTDTPGRMAIFRCAPYLLHGGMQASPLEAGHAVPEGGDEAAALLYAVILHDILGFRRRGNILRMAPHVPPEWEDFTLTLQEGTSTWHISAKRRIDTLTIDGEVTKAEEFALKDDGKIHQVYIPLN